jgi:transglutaminase superfamily protein
MRDELGYYASPGRMTDLSDIAEHVRMLPADVPSLCRIVQGLVVHPFWAERYGVGGVAERDDELQIREASGILAKALEIDPRPLDEGREPTRRVLGNCRDFTTITVALLRDKGVPARGRCGFGLYFQDGKYIDHWVVEWWDGNRWVMTDAQLDAFQVETLKAGFDPLDVPRDRFIDAGRAWALYRRGEADGEQFGVLDMWGPWFIRGNVSRDLASLNKVEMLPWDAWGIDLDAPPLDESTDEVAAVAAAASFDEVRAVYASNESVRVPDVITSYLPTGPVTVRL